MCSNNIIVLYVLLIVVLILVKLIYYSNFKALWLISTQVQSLKAHLKNVRKYLVLKNRLNKYFQREFVLLCLD